MAEEPIDPFSGRFFLSFKCPGALGEVIGEDLSVGQIDRLQSSQLGRSGGHHLVAVGAS